MKLENIQACQILRVPREAPSNWGSNRPQAPHVEHELLRVISVAPKQAVVWFIERSAEKKYKVRLEDGVVLGARELTGNSFIKLIAEVATDEDVKKHNEQQKARKDFFALMSRFWRLEDALRSGQYTTQQAAALLDAYNANLHVGKEPL